MNDFSDLERDLAKLRPVQPSTRLWGRIEQALAEHSEVPSNVIAPKQFRVNWIGLGLGLAAAAAFFVLARVDFHPSAATRVASATPAPQPNTVPSLNFVPAGLTRVVYDRRDEGLVFTPGQERPSRRVRVAQRETIQWRDAQTGASIRVSYPAEEIKLIPVSGQ